MRTLSFAVCLLVAIGCRANTPTGPTTDFITLQSITPAAGTALNAGERVTITAVLECAIVTAEGGFAAMIVQDQRNASLLPFDGRSPEATLRKGTSTVTLSHDIIVPASGSTVNALFPIFIDGSNQTRAVARQAYTVR